MADPAAGIDAHAPWVMMPESILLRLGGRRVSEYTHATHTGGGDLKTKTWAPDVFERLGLELGAAPPLVFAGTRLGRLKGRLAELDAFKETELIAPACHDTASAIAGIPAELSETAYICSGTWSLVGTLTATPVTTRAAFDAGYTNLGAATGDLCFHSLINSMWLLKQSMEAWNAQGREWAIEALIERAADCAAAGLLDMDAEPLMLDSNMPERINSELKRLGYTPIDDVAGNEPVFARTIFESLAARYAKALTDLETMLGRKLKRIHMLGGANRNKLLVKLTEERTGLPVEIGQTESSTIGSLAVQLAAGEERGASAEAVRRWAKRLCGSAG
jgi:rhamnulokinase